MIKISKIKGVFFISIAILFTTLLLWFWFHYPNGFYLKNKVLSTSQELFPGSEVEDLKLFPSPSGYDVTIRWNGKEGFIRWFRDGTKLYLNTVRWREDLDIETSSPTPSDEAERYVSRLYKDYKHTIKEIKTEAGECVVLSECVDPYQTIFLLRIALVNWEEQTIITSIESEYLAN